MESRRSKQEVDFIDSINNLIFLTPVADAETIKKYHEPLVQLIDNNPYLTSGSMGHKSLHQNMWIIRFGAHNNCQYLVEGSNIYLVDRNKSTTLFMTQEGDDGRPERFGTEQLRFNVWYDQTYLRSRNDEFAKKETDNTDLKLRSVLGKSYIDAVVVLA